MNRKFTYFCRRTKNDMDSFKHEEKEAQKTRFEFCFGFISITRSSTINWTNRIFLLLLMKPCGIVHTQHVNRNAVENNKISLLFSYHFHHKKSSIIADLCTLLNQHLIMKSTVCLAHLIYVNSMIFRHCRVLPSFHIQNSIHLHMIRVNGTLKREGMGSAHDDPNSENEQYIPKFFICWKKWRSLEFSTTEKEKNEMLDIFIYLFRF